MPTGWIAEMAVEVGEDAEMLRCGLHKCSQRLDFDERMSRMVEDLLDDCNESFGRDKARN